MGLAMLELLWGMPVKDKGKQAGMGGATFNFDVGLTLMKGERQGRAE